MRRDDKDKKEVFVIWPYKEKCTDDPVYGCAKRSNQLTDASCNDVSEKLTLISCPAKAFGNVRVPT